MYRIRIELRSDLCMANGDGFGSVIDTDICTDNLGVPFIPARRLKGLLRQAAGYINSDKENEIFGEKGKSDKGSLCISDAYIDGYEELKNEITSHSLSSERVTRLFTDVKASTAIDDNGHAKDNSLRFIRVMDNSLPWDRDNGIVFYAEADIDEIYKDDLERVCKALRHMGYKRNRGFGIVKCSLEKAAAKKNDFETINCDKEKNYTIYYAVKNSSELMLPGKGANVTQDYISGQSVMGLLAKEYLKNGTVNEEFEQLFMSSDVKFSNLYITDEKLDEYIPVPGIFGKDKTDKENTICNIVTENVEGKIVKPFKEGYINNRLEIKKPNTEIIYHNANTGKKDKILYTQNCISKGQYFRGSITANGKYINILQKLLLNADIRFGRSKTAQYSKCELVSFDVKEEKKTSISANKYLMFVLGSDVILKNDIGNITTDVNELKKALGIGEAVIHKASSIRYRNISGFNTVMKMHRPHTRAFGAGSVIVIPSDGKAYDSIMYIGERQNEGFGCVRVFDAAKFMDNAVKLERKTDSDTVYEAKIASLCEDIKLKEKMRMDAINYAKEHENTIMGLSMALIGRVTLMTKESTDYDDLLYNNRDDKQSVKRNGRIASIKNKAAMKIVYDLVNDFYDKYLKNVSDLEMASDWEKKKKYIIVMLTIAKYIRKRKEK